MSDWISISLKFWDFILDFSLIYIHSTSNKTKDWALVQNAALVIDIEVLELC